MQIKNRILQFLKPIQIWIQRRGYIETEFTISQVRELIINIKAGDILLSYESGRWTSMFIKGEWDHAAIVDDNLYVVEAVGDKFVEGKNLGGVRKIKLEDWIIKKNHIMVLRHIDYNNISLKAAALSGRFVGKNYDYAFHLGAESLYCSELVYLCYKPFNYDFMDHVHNEILPIDYTKSRHLEVIYNSRL